MMNCRLKMTEEARALLDLRNALAMIREDELKKMRECIEKSIFAVGCERIGQDAVDVDIADELVRALAYFHNFEFTMETMIRATNALRSEGIAPFGTSSGAEPWIKTIQDRIREISFLFVHDGHERERDREAQEALFALNCHLTELQHRLENNSSEGSKETTTSEGRQQRADDFDTSEAAQ